MDYWSSWWPFFGGVAVLLIGQWAVLAWKRRKDRRREASRLLGGGQADAWGSQPMRVRCVGCEVLASGSMKRLRADGWLLGRSLSRCSVCQATVDEE